MNAMSVFIVLLVYRRLVKDWAHYGLSGNAVSSPWQDIKTPIQSLGGDI
jgi:hypothetical protein